MLEHVTANQTRFIAPGLSADTRGIAVGRFCVILLPSVDRVIGLLRGLSEAGQLEDLAAALKIYQVQTPLKSRELIVQAPVAGSHIADAISAVSALMGGLIFTGSSKHFVRYRDSRSPMGYDLDNLHTGKGDFILYDTEFVQAYHREREITLASLALKLSLETERDQPPLDDEQVLLRIAPGLWRAVAGYLHRHQVHCEVAACELQGGGRARGFYLIRCVIRARMEGLFRSTPGIELHRQVTSRIAVQAGFKHPLDLGACEGILPDQQFYIFSSTRNSLDVLTMPPVFVSSEALVDLGQPARELTVAAADGATVPRLEVQLKLSPSLSTPGAVLALRLLRSQAPWLKKLVYLLPSQTLEQCAVCITADQIFITGEAGIEFIPLGEQFYQAAPGVLVPVGLELLPRLQPGVLIDHLGAGPNNLVFFLRDQPAPVRLHLADFSPLSRQTLAPIHIERLGADPPGELTSRSASIKNAPLGVFPLWGFSDDPEPAKE